MSEIEYFYSAHSAFAYIGSARLIAIAADAGRRIVDRPVDLERVVAVTGRGWINNLTPARQAYFSGREIVRWAEVRGVPLMAGGPTFHDNDVTLPNCMLIAGPEQGATIDRLAHAMLEAHWRDDADLADRATLARIAAAVDLDPVPLLAAALSDQVRAVYERNTGDAIERAVFGSPCYFVDLFRRRRQVLRSGPSGAGRTRSRAAIHCACLTAPASSARCSSRSRPPEGFACFGQRRRAIDRDVA